MWPDKVLQEMQTEHTWEPELLEHKEQRKDSSTCIRICLVLEGNHTVRDDCWVQDSRQASRQSNLCPGTLAEERGFNKQKWGWFGWRKESKSGKDGSPPAEWFPSGWSQVRRLKRAGGGLWVSSAVCRHKCDVVWCDRTPLFMPWCPSLHVLEKWGWSSSPWGEPLWGPGFGEDQAQ